MEGLGVKFFSLVFLGLCLSAVTGAGNTAHVHEQELETLRALINAALDSAGGAQDSAGFLPEATEDEEQADAQPANFIASFSEENSERDVVGEDALALHSRRQNNAAVIGDSQKITFPAPRSTSNYARLDTTLSQGLTSFTVCVHMRTNMNSNSQISLVSYATGQHNNELLLFHNRDRFELYVRNGVGNVNLPVWDGAWHAICATWRSSDGAWQIYADGVRRDSGSGLRVGQRVPSGGTWILAQDQDNVGGGFHVNQAFSGELSQVNLWDRVLSPAEIGTEWTGFCNHHGNVIDWATTTIQVFGQASSDRYLHCSQPTTTPISPSEISAPVTQAPEISASTTCTNDYMELSIPEDQLTDINLSNLHWEPDRSCVATTNGTHFLFRTDLYGCGTQVAFDARYVTFRNTIDILGIHKTTGVITREGDIRITSICKYERQEWVDSTFLPIPGGLNFTEEGFGQLEVHLSMFPTRQYQSQYRTNQYPIHLKLRQNIYMQLEVQGHGQNLAVLVLNCKATMTPEPNATPQYDLIKDGCESDPTLDIYSIQDPTKERFGFEAFRFVQEVNMVYVHCEVMVCNAADTGSRCAQGCVRRGKRAAGEEVDMKGRHMIYQGPIMLDDDKEDANSLRLVNAQESASHHRSAPWAMMAAGGGLMALALVVLGAAIVLKRSRRDEWAYQRLANMEEDE